MKNINPQNVKDSLDGVIEAGWKIQAWSLNFVDQELHIKFYPTPHCKMGNKGCNIEAHECFDCSGCKFTECECN